MSQSRRCLICLFEIIATLYLQCTLVVAFQFPGKNLVQIEKIRNRSYINNANRGREMSCLFGMIEDLEAQASAAAETWSVEATIFLEPDVASKVEQQFQDRADISLFRVFGGRRLSPTSDEISKGEGRRSRFIFMHPDLGLDAATAEEEYCTVIIVENVNLKASNTIPNALAGIGINLDQVGDIVVTGDDVVYLVVDPNVAKQCIRLLSKELVGVGINLSVVDAHDFMPDGDIQEMKLSRVLERKMDRKKYEKGYVHLS